MLLRDFINEINTILEGYYNKPVISEGLGWGQYYDEEKGRKIVEAYEAQNIIEDTYRKAYENHGWITIEKNAFTIYGIHFKLKRKSSEMKSKADYKIKMTVVGITLDNNREDQEKYLEMDMLDIRKEYEDRKAKSEKAIANRKEEKVNEFAEMLQEKNLSFKEFKKLYNYYKYESWEVQDMIDKTLGGQITES